ncbi:uncharacterized protein LOC134217690 [Armigeres subalbatus]|uniref:uncharacterized protein LOC134217690 n=1 Tax=Armigeres subalbatus TaxID=124917 RepID=UPI002ECFD876
MTMLFIAIGIMALMFSPKFNSFNVLSLNYSLRYAIESYVFCYLVSKLNEEQNNIVNKLFKFEWGVKLRYSKRFDREFKHIKSTVMIVMMQSQRSLNLSCGGLFEMTMDKFTNIMNKSYTLTMYFWNMKNRNEGLH